MSPEEKLRLTHIAEAAVLIADYVKDVYRKLGRQSLGKLL